MEVRSRAWFRAVAAQILLAPPGFMSPRDFPERGANANHQFPQASQRNSLETACRLPCSYRKWSGFSCHKPVADRALIDRAASQPSKTLYYGMYFKTPRKLTQPKNRGWPCTPQYGRHCIFEAKTQYAPDIFRGFRPPWIGVPIPLCVGGDRSSAPSPIRSQLVLSHSEYITPGPQTFQLRGFERKQWRQCAEGLRIPP